MLGSSLVLSLAIALTTTPASASPTGKPEGARAKSAFQTIDGKVFFVIGEDDKIYFTEKGLESPLWNQIVQYLMELGAQRATDPQPTFATIGSLIILGYPLGHLTPGEFSSPLEKMAQRMDMKSVKLIIETQKPNLDHVQLGNVITAGLAEDNNPENLRKTTEIVKYLVEQGAPVTVDFESKHMEGIKKTLVSQPVVAAARENAYDLVKYLLAKQADLQAPAGFSSSLLASIGTTAPGERRKDLTTREALASLKDERVNELVTTADRSRAAGSFVLSLGCSVYRR